VTAESHPSASLIEELRRQLSSSVLGALAAPDAPIALLDFPHHNNIGDTAIWLGERAVLRNLAVRVASVADESSYCPSRIKAALGSDGTILLHGGGSFGDLWPRRQAFREQVVRDFPGHRIVQLPQTVSVSEPQALAPMRSLLDSHGGVTLLVRDHPSAEACRNQLGVDPEVVPDAAFALGPLARTRNPRIPILCLARTDHEAASTIDLAAEGIAVVDWFDGLGQPTLQRSLDVRVRRTAAAVVSRRPATRRLLGPVWEAGFDAVASRRLERGLWLLSSGEVVITDRLHGHILSLLLGIPHVVVDTTRGKVGNFIDAFTTSSPLVHRAASFSEAQRAAERIVAGLWTESGP
jgi:exopolysaccharide biosynthesis predicted pyruvyltransferase EpsI